MSCFLCAVFGLFSHPPLFVHSLHLDALGEYQVKYPLSFCKDEKAGDLLPVDCPTKGSFGGNFVHAGSQPCISAVEGLLHLRYESQVSLETHMVIHYIRQALLIKFVRRFFTLIRNKY